MISLFSLHPDPLNAEYGDIENVAAHEREVFLGRAGSVLKRRNQDGFEYYSRQFYDGDGKKRQRYLAGPAGSEAAEAAASALRSRIAEVNQGPCQNAAFAGPRRLQSGQHKTDDVDFARSEALAFKKLPDKHRLEILRESGVDFVEVPSLRRAKPSTSFKKKGEAQFRVDLLVPSRDESFPTVAVPELGAHAKGLPYLTPRRAHAASPSVVNRSHHALNQRT